LLCAVQTGLGFALRISLAGTKLISGIYREACGHRQSCQVTESIACSMLQIRE
jgi:hypothetical protein